MNWGRIKAIFFRYFYFFTKLDHLCDLLYWPTLDIFIWGITSIWIQNRQAGEMPHIALAILTGLVFWQIVWRGNYEVSVNLLQEFWNRNLVNLFSTPLKLGEWMAALMLTGLVKIAFGLLYGAFIVWLLYTLNIFTIGWAFLPFCLSLTFSGWFIGFFSAGLIVYFGQRAQMLAWMTAYLFSPFSAVFYPLSALPDWAQLIARGIPMSYIFEGMRQVLNQGTFSWILFGKGMGLNLLYLGASILFFKYMYEKSRNKGLARLE